VDLLGRGVRFLLEERGGRRGGGGGVVAGPRPRPPARVRALSVAAMSSAQPRGALALAPPAAASFDEGELLSLCSGLGSTQTLSDGTLCYVREEDCLGCLLDIQRFLRRDEPATRDVVCKLAEWNVLRQHVVPLLITYASKFELLFNATKARAAQRKRTQAPVRA